MKSLYNDNTLFTLKTNREAKETSNSLHEGFTISIYQIKTQTLLHPISSDPYLSKMCVDNIFFGKFSHHPILVSKPSSFTFLFIYLFKIY